MSPQAQVEERIYAGATGEERRRARRERLVDAGLELLGTQGAAKATVTAVCDRAGLTPRYFYESFGGRDSLALAVLDRVAGEIEHRVLAAYTGEPSGDARLKARAAIEALVRLVTEDPRYGRIMFVESLASPALALRRRESLRAFGRLLAEQARAFYEAPAGARRGIDLAGLLLVGGLAEAIMAWLEGELELSRAELVEDSADLFVAAVETAIALASEAGT